jgi:hypothetical protein
VKYHIGGTLSRGYGRLYPIGNGTHIPGETEQRHISAQGAPKWLRYYLYDQTNHYVDISQSLLSIESQLGRALGVEYPADMLEVRDELTELLPTRAVRDCGKVGKTLMLQIMNGAKFTPGAGAIYEELREIDGCDELFEKVEARTAGFVRRLNDSRSRLLEHITTDFRQAVMKPGVDLVARVVSILCQNVERIIVTKYVHFFQSRCREVTAVIHDGVLFTKQAQDEAFPHDLTLLGKDIILQDTGFDLHFNQEKFELPEKDSWRFESFSTKSKKLSCLWI